MSATLTIDPDRSYWHNNQEAPADGRLLRGLRSQGERGFALLTQRWAALQHVTASPSRITEISRAALVLTQFEHKYVT